jgi:hypothetical protein
MSDEIVECPPSYSIGIHTWLTVGPATCSLQGDIFGPGVRIQCFTPGDLDVTVTPPRGPQGRSRFRVQPGGD